METKEQPFDNSRREMPCGISKDGDIIEPMVIIRRMFHMLEIDYECVRSSKYGVRFFKCWGVKDPDLVTYCVQVGGWGLVYLTQDDAYERYIKELERIRLCLGK
jgi:hypothetical protein